MRYIRDGEGIIIIAGKKGKENKRKTGKKKGGEGGKFFGPSS
jgi:hypothetical protein